MHPTPEPETTALDPASQTCLIRTRLAVLNVLVAVGLTIAVSGWLLRGRPPDVAGQAGRDIHQALTFGWLGLGVSSFLLRRITGRRTALSDPVRRESRFFWSHVLPALTAALIAPLGLLHGWLSDPRLEAIIPFWVVPMALGVLALPRASELDGFDRPMSGAGASDP
jgi:hypothetical protein